MERYKKEKQENFIICLTTIRLFGTVLLTMNIKGGNDIMNMYKSYQFRLYPTDQQIIQIQKTFGCTRLVYNHYLEKRKKDNLTCFDMIKDLPNLYQECPFLKEVDSCSLRCSLFDLDDAFKRYFNHQNNCPKFKGKYSSKRSYRTNYITSTYKEKKYENIKVDLKRKVITLPKLKEVKIRGYRDLESLPGRIINATISECSSGKYYVSVLVEVGHIVPKIIPKRIVGIDLGIKDVVITSDGEKIKNEKIIEKYEKRIKRKQRELARREKGSSNYYKTKKRIAILFQKLKNARKYFIHQITKKLVLENDIIVSETLKVKEMLEEKKVSKFLSDVSLFKICSILKRKTSYYGKRYIQIDSYYPSSQKCSRCGYKNEKVKDLSVRNWICPECGSYHDRDINASQNILFAGIKKYMKELI